MARRGRLPEAERSERRDAILDSVEALLAERRIDDLTMLAVAKRAGASKETLYSWFGGRDGLLTAVVRRNADRSAEAIRAALGEDSDPVPTLQAYVRGLLTLLSSPTSIALNRMAMSSPPLAEVLLAEGRHRVGPIVESYLARADDRGDLAIDDPAEAFTILYGLAVRDMQIRVLLGEEPPDSSEIERRAAAAVDDFLALHPPRAT